MLTLTAAQKLLFAALAEQEVSSGHDDAWLTISTPPKIARPGWEPVFASHLCASLVNLAPAWRTQIAAIDPSVKLAIASIFTHQTPYVHWYESAKRKSCELADIAIIVIDRTNPATPAQCRAMLVQAKQADAWTLHLSGKSELTQWDLLSKRPPFSVTSARAAPSHISFPVFPDDDGLAYGATPPDAPPATPPGWPGTRWKLRHDLLAASNPFTPTLPIQLSLVDLVFGNSGWTFSLPPSRKDWSHFSGSGDDWSELINYLLEITLHKTLSASHRTPGRTQRGGISSMFMQVDGALAGAPLWQVTESTSDHGENYDPHFWHLVERIRSGTGQRGDHRGDGGEPPVRDDNSRDNEGDGAISTVIVNLWRNQPD